MTYSDLQYARNLQKEEQLLYKRRREELQKHVKNLDKLKVIETELSDVKKKRHDLKASIKLWFENDLLPSDIQEQVLAYYCEGNDYIDSNFFRYVRRAFGENK